jgi:hypothetical protein
MDEGVQGLLRDKTRPPGTPRLPLDVAERVVALTLCDPPGETTHWTGRLMAKVAGVSLTSVQRIWKAHGLAPHRIRDFKLSNDPKFAANVCDIVGLYINPPAHAVVLSGDEKSQIQALDRTQPGLPMKKRRAGTMTHDTSATARPPCSPLSTSWRVMSSAAACSGTGIRSSSASSTPSSARSRLARRFTLSSTILPPTSTPR